VQDGTEITPWWGTGHMVVRETMATDPVIDRAISHDGAQFIAVILPAESDLLTAGGKYKWIIEIENLTLDIPFRREIHENISVSAQGVA
jgi:hypothetical protein